MHAAAKFQYPYLRSIKAVGDAHQEISWQQLTFVKQIGAGQFGEVQLMSYSDGVTPGAELVAVKTLHRPVSLGRDILRLCERSYSLSAKREDRVRI
jgi:hypothetical protein